MSNNEIVELLVPRINVNDDDVTLLKWHISEGDEVKEGDVLVEVESSKTIIEVNACATGTIFKMAEEMSSIKVGSALAEIRVTALGVVKEKSTVENIEHVEESDQHTPEKKSKKTSDKDVLITKKAQQLIDELDINILDVEYKGIIRTNELQSFVQLASENKSASTRKNTTAEIFNDGRSLFYDIKNASNLRGKSMFWLVLNYVYKSWFLTNIARWVPYRIIISLHRLRGAKIGKGCFIDPTAIIETAYAENISIGVDVRIAAKAVIMTHIKPPHYHVENRISPIVSKPVVIEDYAFIGIGAIIMPNVTIGKSSIVSSGSVVLSDVPEYSMVAGNPATVIRKLNKPE